MKTSISSGASIFDDLASSARSLISDVEAEARRDPLKAALYAVGAGLVLRLLPVRQITLALFRLVLVLLKPAAFALGFYKLYELMIGREWQAGGQSPGVHSGEMGE